MLFLTILGCGFNTDELTHDAHAELELAGIDAGAGDGRDVAEFVDDTVSADFPIDWSFLNLAALAADQVELTPAELPATGDCSLDEQGEPAECSFWVNVAVSSDSGWWDDPERTDFVSWMPGTLHFCFGGHVPLSAEQISAVSSALEDDGISFSGDLTAYLCRGAEGSGDGLPSADQQVNVFTVAGGDNNTGVEALLAADDTLLDG